MLKQLAPLALTALLVLLSGCVDSLPADQRLYCLDLTEKAYAFVPECMTEQQCFSLLEKGFFSFDHSVFSGQVQSRLYSYKNSVALSWLYFNKARQSISRIHAICAGNQGISDLLFHLNELTHNMAKAFEFSDQANRLSFAVLLLEYEALQEQDVQLIKEEPLLDDFALIADNLNKLSSQARCVESHSYACFYLAQTKNFEALVAQTGFRERIVSEVNAFDLLMSPSEAIANYIDSGLSVPVIGQIIQPLLSYLSNISTGREAIGGLQRTPAFQFMQSYSRFMGENNSCLTRFSKILSNDVLHRQQLMQRNEQLEASAEQGIRETQQSIDALLSGNYASFDQNFFHQLYAGLGQESSLAAQSYSIRDFGELRENAEKQLALLRQRLMLLRQQDALQQLSLGEKASALKQLNNEIGLLQDNLDYLSNEVIEGLLVLCQERALFIEQQLDEASLPEEYLLRAADLRSRAKFKLNLFREARETEQKLFLCSEMVQRFGLFSSALQDFEEYSLREEASLHKCFSFLNLAFENAEALGLDLHDFALRFHELQAIEQPYNDIDAVRRICLSLEEDLRSFLQRQAAVKSVEESFALSNSLLSSLQLAEAKGAISSSKVDSLESQLAYFQKFFVGESLAFENALPLLPDLEESLSEFASALAQHLNSAIISFVEEHASVSIEPIENAVAGLAFDETVSVEFDNPFNHSIDWPLTLAVPFDKSVGSAISSSPNIISFWGDGKSLVVDLNDLPIGKTFLQFSTASIVEKTESLALLSATSEEATFSKKIEIECSRSIEKLQVNSTLLDSDHVNFGNILVLQEENSLSFIQNENRVSFFLENCFGKEKVDVVFSVEQPVAVSLRLLEEQQSAQGKISTYSVEIENRLPLKFGKIEVILPFPFSEKTVSGIELFDSLGKEIKFLLLPNGNIAFGLTSLLPIQKGVLYTLKVFSKENASLPEENPTSETPSRETLQEIQSISEKISALDSELGIAEETIALLDGLFSSVSDELLISTKYIPPISGAELDKLGLKLSSLRSFQSKNHLQDFSRLAEQGNFDSALEKSDKFAEQLDEKLLEAEDVASRLNNAFNAIKEDAVVSYNSAAELFNQNQSSSEAQDKLSQAREQLLKGNFLESIASSKNASGLIALKPENQIDLPVFIWPIAIGSALVLIVRFKKKERAKQRKELVRRIERNW